MQYFINCTTIEEAKSLYRELCKKNHPDLGGSTEAMQAINAEYSAFMRGEMKRQGMSEKDVSAEMEIEAVFMERIQAIAHLEGIVVEIVGRWIWVTGATFPVKDALKAAGYFWASKKKCWFWRSDEDKSHAKSELSLEEIRAKHGSRVVNAYTNRLA
jgi:hypothetical protein